MVGEEGRAEGVTSKAGWAVHTCCGSSATKILTGTQLHKYSRAHNYTNTHGHTIAQIDTYIHTHMRTNAKGDKLSQTIPYHLGCSFTPSEGGGGGSSDAILTKYNKY